MMPRESTPADRWLWLLLTGLGLFFLIPAGWLPLAESTEARYAEIAREMVVSGNYLEPVFNGVKHFHKPPLAYWLIAAGLKLFGFNDFGARFFGIVTALITVFFVRRIARVVTNHERTARLMTLLFVSSILFIAVSRIASTDIYLTCCTTAALYHLLDRRYGERRPRQAYLAALWLGLGFLAKGPVIFLFTLLPLVIAKFFDPGHRRLFTWRESGVGLLIFAAIALPWYLLVIDKNPALLDYFLRVQTADRVMTNRFNRAEPIWFFLAVLLGGFLPWSYFLCGGVSRLKKAAPRAKVALIYFLVPLIFFSLNSSKLATYIMPLFPAVALFTAEVCNTFALPLARRLAFGTFVLLTLTLGVAGFFYPPLREGVPVLLGAALLLALTLVPLKRHLLHDSFFAWGALFLLLFGLAAHGIVVLTGPEFKSYETMAAAINRRDPGRSIEVLVYRDFLPSLSFNRNRLVTTALGPKRESQFQDDLSFRQTTLDSLEATREFLATRKELFVVAGTKAFVQFQQAFPASCDVVFAQRHDTAYLCRFPPAPATPLVREALASLTRGEKR